MIRIINEHRDPRINLAVEEYALNYLDPNEEYVILWQNEPTVVVGRNQNTVAEVNGPFIKERGIHVVRRLSGGGAVYHDLGNLNFTFIVDAQKERVSNFEYFTRPVIEALASFGVKAEFSGRNDITIDGKKFSGNAQYWSKNRLLHHGTILFNSDLDVVGQALNVQADKLQSKGVKSVRSRVTNIYPYMPNPISIEEFKAVLLEFLIPGKRQDYTLSDSGMGSCSAAEGEAVRTLGVELRCFSRVRNGKAEALSRRQARTQVQRGGRPDPGSHHLRRLLRTAGCRRAGRAAQRYSVQGKCRGRGSRPR